MWRSGSQDSLRAQIATLATSLEGLHNEQIATLATSLEGLRSEFAAMRQVLQLIYDREPDNRQQLYSLRRTPEYELAFSEPEPLVSVVIPTWMSTQTLCERALPSVLAQSYANLEIIVIGECAPKEAADAITKFGDSRITYRNLNRRGPYDTDSHGHWLQSGTPPYNDGVRCAHGRWIAPLADDDAFRPDHVAQLLQEAQKERFELCYGSMCRWDPNGTSTQLFGFPPECGNWGLQATIYHAGLRFMELELADALFSSPNDWGLCRRMLRAGVRIGCIADDTVDYYPSKLWKVNESVEMEGSGRDASLSAPQTT